MTLRDPIAIYNAEGNVQAHVLKAALEASGIPAFVIEDVSGVGLWMLGKLPFHKPQIWVEKTDVEQANRVIEQFETEESERRKIVSEPDGPIEVICEECGKTSHFAAAQNGTVQECPSCGAYVDVGDNEFTDEWRQGSDEED